MSFLFALFTLFALYFLQLATAVPISPRDVYVPPITYPTTGTTWAVGQHYNVTWDTSNPPKEITNPTGSILLRKDDLSISPITLATNFSILLGSMEIEVPAVSAASDYRIVLFGDSGNWSPDVTITE